MSIRQVMTVLIAATVWLTQPLHGATLSGEAAASAMSKSFAKSGPLRAKFRQTVSDRDGRLVQESSGEFTAAQPNRLNWSTLLPAPQQLITDGTTIWLYDPDLQQVTVDRVNVEANDAPMLVLSGDVATLSSKYVVTADGADDRWSFAMRPRNDRPGQQVSFTELHVEVYRGDVKSLLFRDSLEQTTEVVLSDVEHPQAVADSLFRFRVPPDVEVVQR